MPTDQMVLWGYFQANKESVKIVHDLILTSSRDNILAEIPVLILSFDEHPR